MEWPYWWTALLLAIVLGATLAAAAPPPGASASSCRWRVAKRIPNAFLSDIAVNRDGDVWAVGYSNQRGTRPLTVHWNPRNRTWSVVRDREIGQLTQVILVADGDVRVFGNHGKKAFTRNWDGSDWHESPLPFAKGEFSATASTNIWALVEDPRFAYTLWRTKMNGWVRVPLPKTREKTPFWGPVLAVGQSVWINDGGESTSWLYRGQPERWTSHKQPVSYIEAMAAAGENDVFSVGDVDGDEVAHWDGRSWRKIRETTPFPAGFTDVAALGQGRAWAVGDDEDVNVKVSYWNGRNWSDETLTALLGDHTALFAVAASDDEVWAAGRDGLRGLIIHRTCR